MYGVYSFEILYGKERRGPKVKKSWKCSDFCHYKLVLDWKNLPMEYQLVPQRKGSICGMGGKCFYEDSFNEVCVLVCSYL